MAGRNQAWQSRAGRGRQCRSAAQASTLRRSWGLESLEDRWLMSVAPIGGPSTKPSPVLPFEAGALFGADRFEANDAIEDATPLGSLGDRTELNLSLHEAENDDWYRFTAVESGSMTITLSFQNSQGNVNLSVLNEDENVVASAEGTTNGEQVTFAVTAGDSYYLYIYGYAGATNPDYDLVINGPGVSPSHPADSQEPNDAFDAPKVLGPIAFHAAFDLSIHEASNWDYFQFTAMASGPAIVDLQFAHADGDVDVVVYDQSGGELGSSDSAADDEQVSFNVTAGQNYLVYAYGYNGDIHPDYDLYITAPGPTGQISGIKWNDLDGDGVRDSGEPGLAGWTLYVDANVNGQFDAGEPSAVSATDNLVTQVDETGTYTITGVQPGMHVVAEVQQPGWRQTTPNSIPDLVGTSFDSEATLVDAADLVEIAFEITNQGLATARGYDIGFYLSEDPIIETTDFNLGYLENPIDIAAGRTLSEIIAVELPAPGDAFWQGEGTYYLGIIADDLLEMAESNEQNNSNQGELLDRKTITVRNIDASDLPDLIGTAFNVTAATAVSGTTVNLSYSFKNEGTNPAEGFDVGFYLSRDAVIDPETDQLLQFIEDPVDLAANATHSGSVNVILPGAGSPIYAGDGVYYIGQYVDDFHEVPELSETNNTGRGSGLDLDTLTITGTALAPTDFQIVVQFIDNSLTASQQAVFNIVAQRWTQIITGDLPDVNVAGIGLVDDLVIKASAPAIDGPGNILGQAGPQTVRNISFLPSSGMMQFDSADVAALETSGQLDEVILHEMGHVLGIGTLWSNLNLVTGAGGANPRYTGAGAIAEYQSIFNTQITTIPVENTGGPGTRDSHWRDSVFVNELMTGFLSSGPINPISRVTVAALDDLGYTVNMAAADNYSALAPAALQTTPTVSGKILAISDAIQVLEVDQSGANGSGRLVAQGLNQPMRPQPPAPLKSGTRVASAESGGSNTAGLTAQSISPLPFTYSVQVLPGQTTTNVDFGNQLLPTVVGRHIFYNQSRFDGGLAAAGPADDGAIATDKQALLAGQTATFANYTSYSRGINGLMVDIASLPGNITAGDFEFKAGNTNTPSAWTSVTTAPSVTVRPGAGIGGSSRVTLIFPNFAIVKQWLQITVKANANTGLTAPDVFYFGNAIGEAGNNVNDARVTVSDEVAARNNPHVAGANNPTSITSRWDFNRDGSVTASDQTLARTNLTTVAAQLRLITIPAALQAQGLRAQALVAANDAAETAQALPLDGIASSPGTRSTNVTQTAVTQPTVWPSTANTSGMALKRTELNRIAAAQYFVGSDLPASKSTAVVDDSLLSLLAGPRT